MKRSEKALQVSSGHNEYIITKSWQWEVPIFTTTEAKEAIADVVKQTLSDPDLTARLATVQSVDQAMDIIDKWLNEEIWVGESK